MKLIKPGSTPESTGVIRRYLDGFLHLLFPSKCLSCQQELAASEAICCSICLGEIAFTHFEEGEDSTQLDELFWGRMDVHSTYSLLYYEKSNNVKPILQALKYQNRPDVGWYFGEMIGKRLKEHPKFSTIDLLIAVPLHRKKRYTRGYNQSEELVKGLQRAWPVKSMFSALSKHKHTISQTTLGRFKRWDNVENLFHVDPRILSYRHIAIVDDVVTTGATLEAIMRSIRKISPSIQISVISLALAK